MPKLKTPKRNAKKLKELQAQFPNTLSGKAYAEYKYDVLAGGAQNALVACLVGDFYEFFGPDAEAAHKVLDYPLTERHSADGSTLPMLGFPYWLAKLSLDLLREAGYEVWEIRLN